ILTATARVVSPATVVRACPVSRLELDHRPPHNFSRSQSIKILIGLIERDGLYGVADLALSGKRPDLAQVGIVTPERTVEGLFAGNSRKQRDIDAIADHPHINIVAADRQQTERQLNRLRSTCAVNDRIEIALTRGVPEFPDDGSQGLV